MAFAWTSRCERNVLACDSADASQEGFPYCRAINSSCHVDCRFAWSCLVHCWTLFKAAVAKRSSVERIFGKLKEWARALKRQSLVVYFAARDPRTPTPSACSLSQLPLTRSARLT